MKCPRCGLADLNSGECPICHYEAKPRFLNFPNLRKRLEGHWERDHALRKLWQMNLDFYAQTKAFVLLIAIVVFIAVMVLLIEAANFLVSVFAAWFALMAINDFHRMRKAAKR